jgi:hypothetical protein
VIALLVMTDGRRDCIRQAIPSALASLHGPVTRRVIHDDSADPDYRDFLAATFPTFEIIHPARRLGFGGAIRNAWSILAQGPERFVWHHEDDFTFNRPVDLLDLMVVLDQNPHLLQLALRRQPWNDEERAAGGIVEQHPDDYAEMVDHAHRHWLEHRRFFTTNPSLYRRSLCEGGWLDVEHSEGVMTHRWIEDPAARFGFWGPRDSGEWVTHVGHQRVGVGY